MLDLAQLIRAVHIASEEWLEQEEDGEYSGSMKWFCQTLAELDSPFEIHVIAACWNWDWGLEGPNAVVAHPCCDYGTALMLYWLADPEYYHCWHDDPGEWYHEELGHFIEELEDALLSGRFQRRQIACNPVEIVAEWRRETWNPRLVPEPLRERTDGVNLNPFIAAAGLGAACHWYRLGQISDQQLVMSIDEKALGSGFRSEAEVVLRCTGGSSGDRTTATEKIQRRAEEVALRGG